MSTQAARMLVWLASQALVESGLLGFLIAQGFWNEQETPQLAIRRLQVVWQPQGGLLDEDVRITTHDFLNLTDDAYDDTWIEDDFLVVEDAMDTMLAAFSSGGITTQIKTTQYRWYRLQAGSSLSGPPVRIVEKNIPATPSTAAVLPLQNAYSVTERTALAKHWGRFYIPNIRVSSLGTDGRIPSGTHSALATTVETFYNTVLADSAQIQPVVWSNSRQMALRVGEIQVDDVSDIIRRRRPRENIVRTRRELVEPA